MPPTLVSQATLELPWTAPPLSLNDTAPMSRKARYARNSKVQDVRDTAFWLARQHRLPKALTHVTVQLHYQPRDRRHRDAINLTATQKALVDGLVGTPQKPGYGLTLGDDGRYLTDLMPIIHAAEKGKPGRLWLELTWDQP